MVLRRGTTRLARWLRLERPQPVGTLLELAGELMDRLAEAGTSAGPGTEHALAGRGDG